MYIYVHTYIRVADKFATLCPIYLMFAELMKLDCLFVLSLFNFVCYEYRRIIVTACFHKYRMVNHNNYYFTIQFLASSLWE